MKGNIYSSYISPIWAPMIKGDCMLNYWWGLNAFIYWLVIIGGLFYYFISNARKKSNEEKVLKK